MSSDTLYHELYELLCTIPTIDAHEHLSGEPEALAQRTDFYTLFESYCPADLVAAGATPSALSTWADGDIPLMRRWESFKPYFSAIRTGGYARAVMLVIRDIYGYEDLDDDTVEAISRALAHDNTPGLYDRLLRDRCNLAACIDCWRLEMEGLPDYFYHLAPSPEVVDIHQPEIIPMLRKKYGNGLHTLSDMLEVMDLAVESWRANPKVVGIKSAHAYERSIRFEKRPRHDAEIAFNRLLTNETHQVSLHEAIPLQDYLMYELVARAEAVGLPMVFHTGIQAGNWHRITDANPLHLQPLLEEFPNARFDLYHGGMPWVREIAILAKYFPNVHLNMAWMHIINPAQARSALSEWLDMVPNTKIFGFGGDYHVVQLVYGHLTLARRNIARVLAEKVQEGSYTRAEAEMVARRLMFDNSNEFYQLHLDRPPL